jgi:GT2 family glycosyltransferase
MKTLVVIYNHNLPDLTDQLFESLESHRDETYDIVLIDNGSTDSGKSKYTTHETGQNIYFGGGLNLAMQLFLENKQYDSLLSLNNDLILHGGNFVKSLRKVMFENDYKIVSPCVLQPQKNQCKWKYMHCWSANIPRQVKWVDFQAPLMHRDLVEKINQFDLQLIYGWGQDVYSGIVCEQNDWKVAVVDWCPVIHYSAHTYKQEKSDLTLNEYCMNAERNMFEFFEKQNLIHTFNLYRELSANYNI